MSITNFMNLELPTVSVTLGPEWAEELNAALETIDSHDHSSGKGTKVPVSGIDINANLNFQNKKAYNLFSTQYQEVSVVLTGASNADSVSAFDGDMYWTNGAGNSVQITSGGSVVTSPGTVQSLERTPINTDTTISPSDTFVMLAVDTTSSRTITLPLASSVASGRIYCIKDESGMSNTNPLTIDTQGGDTIDLAASQSLISNFGCIWVSGDGLSNWSII